MFYNQLPTSDTIHKWTLAPEVGRFHISALTEVEPGHRSGHHVSGHETDVSNHVSWSIANFWQHSQVDPGSRSGSVPHRCRHWCWTRPLGWTPIVQIWNWCVKLCFIINCQLLTPFTSGLWLQKWAVSTWAHSPNPNTEVDTKCPAMEPMCQLMFYNQVPTSDTIHKWILAPPMCNLNTWAYTKCSAMEPMCQIMFYNQLPTSGTIHKWTLAPEVGLFHIGAFNKVLYLSCGTC